MLGGWTAQRTAKRGNGPPCRNGPPPSTRERRDYTDTPWHFLNFLPEPHGQGSLRPTFVQSTGPLAAAFWMSLMLRAFPAPTMSGSRLAVVGFSFGVSAGPTSTT